MAGRREGRIPSLCVPARWASTRSAAHRDRRVLSDRSASGAVNAPRVNDRRTDQDGERRRFTSRILPPYMRCSPKVAEVLPVLYLRGLSTGDFREALAALLGDDAAGLSATNIARLTNEWETEYRAFQKRSLTDRDYVYVWVDGVHFNVRLEDDRLCRLVMIGVRPDGTKELITVEDGYRESAESSKTVLRDLKRRGMRPPVVAVGDGASASGRRYGTSGRRHASSATGSTSSATSSTSSRSGSSPA
jgi:putative transposase